MIVKRIKISITFQIIFFGYLQIFGNGLNFGSLLFLTQTDSLKTVLNQTSIDTTKVNLLNEISWNLAPTDFNQSFNFADSARKLAQKINFTKGEADAFNNLGELYRYNGDIKASIENHKTALKIFNNLHNQKDVAKTFSNLGVAYFNVSDFDNSLKNFNNALKIYEKIHYSNGIADNLSNIGNLLSTLKKYQSALVYYKRALLIFEKGNNLQNAAIQNGNIGLVYFELKEFNKSLEYYDKAISEFKNNHDEFNYSIFLGNIGLVYVELKRFSEALSCYQQSLAIAKKLNDQYGIANQYGNIGKLKLAEYKINKSVSDKNNLIGVFKSAEKNLKLAVNEFHNLGMIEEEKNYLLELSDLYKQKSEYKNALEIYTYARNLQDSVTAKTNRKMIAELEIKQQLEKKENEVLFLNQENEKKSLIGFGLLIIILIVSLTSIIVFVFYRKKKKQNILLIKTEKNLRTKTLQLEIYKGQLEQLVYERTKELEDEIKERKSIEDDLVVEKEKAESASKSKSVFLANMSHELRTPLVGILGYSDLMKDMLEDIELKEMADGIHRTGKRLLTTVSLVLDLARIESGTNEIKLTPVDVIQEIKDICSGFKGAMSNKKLGFNINLHADTFSLNVDQSMFRVIIENLVNNAFKFTSKGKISVESFIETDIKYSNFVIKVKDTGIGIKKDKIDLIFKEFKQLSEGFTKDFQGSGLGLSITKKYVELLGGKISVDSKFGEGTAFTVEFPIKIQSAA